MTSPHNLALSGVSPESGPERVADELDALASQLQGAADRLRALAIEVRKIRVPREIEWDKTFHPPPMPRTDVELPEWLLNLLKEALEKPKVEP